MGERALNFSVSGKLWHRSLVMQDRETGTLWSHLLGQAMEGELKGAKLKMFPSQMTDWKTWLRANPDTTVLNMSRTSQEYRREFYRDPALFVLGLRVGARTKAWTFDRLLKERVVNDRVGDLPVVLFFDPESLTAQAFERRVGGAETQFRITDQRFVDERSGSSWDPIKGKALDGASAGQQLIAVPAIVSGLMPWAVFHPDTEGISNAAFEYARERSFLRRQGRRGNRRQ